MSNDKAPNKTLPGEMPPGKFHFNPGNMSGKQIGNAGRHEDDIAKPLDDAAKRNAAKRKQPKPLK